MLSTCYMEGKEGVEWISPNMGSFFLPGILRSRFGLWKKGEGQWRQSLRSLSLYVNRTKRFPSGSLLNRGKKKKQSFLLTLAGNGWKVGTVCTNGIRSMWHHQLWVEVCLRNIHVTLTCYYWAHMYNRCESAHPNSYYEPSHVRKHNNNNNKKTDEISVPRITPRWVIWRHPLFFTPHSAFTHWELCNGIPSHDSSAFQHPGST